VSREPSWDEFFNRLKRDIEETVREVVEASASAVESLAGPYRTPRVDFTVADGFVYLVAEMPGCDKNKIELTVEGRNITIEGEYMKPQHEVMGRLYPFKAGKGFRRTLQLPREWTLHGLRRSMRRGCLWLKPPSPPRGV
jgi:HSP20 family molecular chaperone IbpA